MAKFCTECGAPLKEGATFCSACGAKAPAEKKPEAAPETPAAPQPAYQTQQTYTPSAPAAQPVSTAYYFWMMLLFAVPVIGLIVCLVTAFSGEDASRKNFSRAALIWIVVGAVLAVVAVVALALLSNAAMPIIRSSFEGIM